MKKLIVILLFIQLFYQFPDGSWIYGFNYASTAIAIDSEGRCVKYEGEERESAHSTTEL